MTGIQIKALSSRKVHYRRLPEHFREAIDSASDVIPTLASNDRVTVEVYRTADLRFLIEEIWGWPCSMDRLTGDDYEEDRERVQTIIDLQRSGKPIWPYVSYWALDFQELAEVQTEDDGVSVLNHGDGWHRTIAAVEQKREQIEIIFL